MKLVKVHVDGSPVKVPELVRGERLAKAVLGVSLFDEILLEHRAGDDELDRLHRREDPLDLTGEWRFLEGDRYAVVDGAEVKGKEHGVESEDPWHRDPEWWKP